MSTEAERHLGALMSDLVAEIHALVTEDERERHLKQRVAGIKATCGALVSHVERVQKERDELPVSLAEPDRLCGICGKTYEECDCAETGRR